MRASDLGLDDIATGLDVRETTKTVVIKEKRSPIWLLVVVMSLPLPFVGLFAGYYYGDKFGREHAQFNNPVLREHYIGQCLSYLREILKKSLRLR